jgi:RNA polymerase sigma-70 factor (ECF subfamily)
VQHASDEALVAGMAAGDRDAATAFVRRFERRVFGCAMAVVGDRGRAEDVAQEAFVRAWRHAAAFDPRRATVATWLLAITRNLGIDSLRVERVRPADPVADTLEFVDLSWHNDPEAMAAHAADVAAVSTALQELPVEQRRAVLLASLLGRTAREIGEIESIPVGTAKTRIRNGLIRLRESLDVETELS